MMGALFELLPLEPRSRMTGVFTARVADFGNHPVHALGHMIWLGEGQDPDLEWDFLGSHLLFHVGGVTGMGPDGSPWMCIIQLAPTAGSGDGAVEIMSEAMDRALEFNPAAWVGETFAWSMDELIETYEGQGVDADDIDDWGMAELVFGLLAECCNVELTQIVAGRVAQCAFPGDEHECTHDVFTDVFSRWVTGDLMIDESTLDDDEDDADEAEEEDEDGRFTREELLEYTLPDLRDLAREVGFKPWQIAACGDDLGELADLLLSVYEPDYEDSDDDWAQQFVEEANAHRTVRKVVRAPGRPPKRQLKKLKTSRLRLMAVAAGWTVDDAEAAKRKKLIKALGAPKRRIGKPPERNFV